MTEGSEGPTRIRASDAEREQYAATVRDAVSEGRLSLDEGEQRLAKVYAARFRDELPPLVTDLPHEEVRAGAHPHWHGRRWSGMPDGPPGAPWPGVSRPGPGETPEPHRAAHRGLVTHIGLVAALTAVLVVVWAATGAHVFWPAIPLAFLAFGLFRHGCRFGWRRRWYGRRPA